MIEEGKQAGEMDLWVDLPGVVVRPVTDFLTRYFRALWPDMVEEALEISPSVVEMCYYPNQEAWDAVEKWGITTTTAPGIVYILIAVGQGVNIAYSDTTPEEHARALEIQQNLRANQGLLWGP